MRSSDNHRKRPKSKSKIEESSGRFCTITRSSSLPSITSIVLWYSASEWNILKGMATFIDHNCLIPFIPFHLLFSVHPGSIGFASRIRYEIGLWSPSLRICYLLVLYSLFFSCEITVFSKVNSGTQVTNELESRRTIVIVIISFAVSATVISGWSPSDLSRTTFAASMKEHYDIDLLEPGRAGHLAIVYWVSKGLDFAVPLKKKKYRRCPSLLMVL